MRRHWILTGLVLLTTAACERQPGRVDPRLQPRLQSLATTACLCDREARADAAKKACWGNYKRLEAGAADARWSTSCAPVSASGDSFNTDTPDEFAITTRYSSPVGHLCTESEASAVEAGLERANRMKLARAETEAAGGRALRDAKKGREVASKGGCAG